MAGLKKEGMVAAVEAGGEADTGGADGGFKGVKRWTIDGDGFFEVDVFAGLGGGDGERGVEMRGGADDDGVNIGAGEEHGGIFEDVESGELACALAGVGIGVGGGDEAGVTEAGDETEVGPVGDEAAAEDAEAERQAASAL